MVIVTAKSDTTISVSGMGEYKQAGPYIYVPTDEETSILTWVGPIYFAPEGGLLLARFYMMTDYIKAPTEQLVLLSLFFMLVIMATIYCLAMLVLSGLRKVAGKPAPGSLGVSRNIAQAFYLAVVVNVVLCALSGMNFAEYASLKLHFVVSALTLPAFAVYVWFFIRQYKKKCSRADIRLCAITGTCLLIELIAVIALNL